MLVKKDLNRMGTASAMSRDENKFLLENLIKNNRVRTVKQAADQIGVSQASIRSYLKDLQLSLESSERDLLGFALRNRSVRTVTAGVNLIGCSRACVIRYAKELNIAIIDDLKNELIPGRYTYCLDA